MNEFDILKAVGDVDAAYIDEALAARRIKKRAKAFVIAAAACVAALIGFFVLKSLVKPGDTLHGTNAFNTTSEPELIATPNAVESIEPVSSGSPSDTEPWYHAAPPTPEFVYNGRTYTMERSLPNGFSLDSEIVGDLVAHIDYTYTFGERDQSLQVITCYGSVKGDAYSIAGLDEKYALIVAEDRIYHGLNIYTTSELNNSPVPELVIENMYKLSAKIDSIGYEYALEHEFVHTRIHEGELVLQGIRNANGEFIPELQRFIDAAANGEIVRLSTGQGFDKEDRTKYIEYNEYVELRDISNQLVHLKVNLTSGISAGINVLRGGYLEFESSFFGENFIKADESELMPFLEWIFGGKCDEENRFALLPMDQVHERLRENRRFGGFVPKVIPEGYKVSWAYIDYYSKYDAEPGKIKNLDFCYTAEEEEIWIGLEIGDIKDLWYSNGKIVFDSMICDNMIEASELSLETLKALLNNPDLSQSLLIKCDDTVLLLDVPAFSDIWSADDVYTLLSSAIW